MDDEQPEEGYIEVEWEDTKSTYLHTIMGNKVAHVGITAMTTTYL